MWRPGSGLPARRARVAVGAMTNRQIAEQMSPTRKTIETHLTNAYRRLGITAQPQLAAYFDTDRTKLRLPS